MIVSSKRILGVVSLGASGRDGNKHPSKRSHLVPFIAKKELRLVQPINETRDPVSQSAEIPSYLVISGKVGHREKRFLSHDERIHALLDKCPRKRNGTLQRHVPFPH